MHKDDNYTHSYFSHRMAIKNVVNQCPWPQISRSSIWNVDISKTMRTGAKQSIAMTGIYVDISRQITPLLMLYFVTLTFISNSKIVLSIGYQITHRQQMSPADLPPIARSQPWSRCCYRWSEGLDHFASYTFQLWAAYVSRNSIVLFCHWLKLYSAIRGRVWRYGIVRKC